MLDDHLRIDWRQCSIETCKDFIFIPMKFLFSPIKLFRERSPSKLIHGEVYMNEILVDVIDGRLLGMVGLIMSEHGLEAVPLRSVAGLHLVVLLHIFMVEPPPEGDDEIDREQERGGDDEAIRVEVSAALGLIQIIVTVGRAIAHCADTLVMKAIPYFGWVFSVQREKF